MVFKTQHRVGTGMEYHRHAQRFVTIVIDGSYVEVHDDAPRRCCVQTLVLHEAGEMHADHFLSDTRCLNIELHEEARFFKPGVLDADAELQIIVRAVANAFTLGHRHELEKAIGRLRESLCRPSPSQSSRPEWLRWVLAEFEWTSRMPLQEAAQRACVHPTHFSRDFRRHMGMTPSAYRRALRIRLASKMLLQSEASLASIAQRCGFDDQSHFNNAFRSSLQLSPGRYRRAFVR
jgi:AraC-like DNA-binding protein